MKHLLNNLSEEEKNSIREQHTGGMKVVNENFDKLLNAKLGDAKPITEGIWSDIFGKPSVDRASKDSYKSKGFSVRGRDNQDTEEEKHFTMFNGQKFYDEDIEYADVNDTGKIPRVEGGKLVIANPIWSE